MTGVINKTAFPLKFQSTLPHKEWLTRFARLDQRMSFNPHSHIRSDWYRPAWSHRQWRFNPHSHIRSDICGYEVGGVSIGFQSTLPHKEWLTFLRVRMSSCLFQSTLPHKEWQNFFASIRFIFLFQSTLPHKEWRWTLSGLYRRKQSFNPHSHIRSDMFFDIQIPRCSSFNPHSHIRSDMRNW